MTTAVPVAFVGGHGRSGSTLLSRVLGAVPGFVSVGELCYLWDQGVVMDRMCGCGKPFSRVRILDRGRQGRVRRMGPGRRPGAAHAAQGGRAGPLYAAAVRSRASPRTTPASCGSTRRRCRRSTTRSGPSPGPRWSWTPRSTRPRRTCYGTCPGVELRLVHLVRSVYGVCYSWSKTVARPDRDGKPMPQYPPARTAAEWSAFNFLLDALRLRGVPTQLVHYEDFVAAPRAELTAHRPVPRPRRRPPPTWRSWGSRASSCPATTASPATRCGSGPGRSSCASTRPGGPSSTRRARRLISVVSGPAILRYGYAGDLRR